MGGTPPEMDSGWSWILVIGFGISSFILGGFVKAFGVFFAAFATNFEASASATSLITGTRSVMFMVVAPLAAVLSERYSERAVLIGSALLSSVGCMAAAFSPNMEMVVFSTGIIMGAGVASYFGPIQIAIGKYFDKRKSIAIALSFSGMCLAQIVMSPVNILMLETYALSGTLILYSGLLLHIIVAAALVRPIKATSRDHVVKAPPLPVQQKALSMLELASVHELCSSREFAKDANAHAHMEHSDLLLQTHLHKDLPGSKDEDVFPMQPEVKVANGCDKAEDSRAENAQNRGCCAKILRSVQNVLDFSLLKNKQFTMYALAQCSALVAFSNIPVYLFPRAEDYGLTGSQSALLLTIMGCVDLVSRLLQGVFGDVEKVGPKVLFTGGVFAFGVASAVVPFTTTFLHMAIVSGFLGLFGSTTIVLNMPILVETVGLHKLSKAVALTSFFSGITNAIAPPLLGYIKDATTSYNGVFLACAGTLFLGAAFMAVIPVLRRLQGRPGG